MSTVDLNALPSTATLTITREESSGERRVRLFKDVTLFLLAIALVCVIVGLCVHTLLSADASTDARKWAMSLLTGSAGGLIGYLVRK